MLSRAKVPPVIRLDPYIGAAPRPTFRECAKRWEALRFLRERGITEPHPLRSTTTNLLGVSREKS